MKRRFLCSLLTVCMLFALFPVLQTTAAADSNVITDEEISQRIDELYNIISENGGYFNVDHGTGCGTKKSGHGCKNCTLQNIIKSEWFIESFGNVDEKNFLFPAPSNHVTGLRVLPHGTYSMMKMIPESGETNLI